MSLTGISLFEPRLHCPDCCASNRMFTSQADFLSTLTWGKGLLELLSLLLVCDDEGVQVSAAAHLEFNIVLVLLDLHG